MRALVAAVALLGTVGVPAQAAPPSYVVTLNSLYVPGDVTVAQGGALTLVDGEAIAHDLTSSDYENGAPLFQSAIVAGAGAQAVVRGVESLGPGIYPFFCSLHEAMRGTVNVVTVP